MRTRCAISANSGVSRISSVRSAGRPDSIPEAVFLSSRIVVMSPRPGRIVDVIESGLPADRTLDIRDTPEFAEISHRVRMSLQVGHGGH